MLRLRDASLRKRAAAVRRAAPRAVARVRAVPVSPRLSEPGISFGEQHADHVRYVDLRGTLSNGPNYRTWWANELHPTGRGFAAVAERFAAVIART